MDLSLKLLQVALNNPSGHSTKPNSFFYSFVITGTKVIDSYRILYRNNNCYVRYNHVSVVQNTNTSL